MRSGWGNLGRGILLVGLLARPLLGSTAQPVPIPEDPSAMPQLEIDGVGIGTLNYGNLPDAPGNTRPHAGINFDDSSLLVGGAQRLYQAGGIGSLGFGVLTPEQSNSGTGTPLFVHQAFLDYQTESTEWLIGRTDSRTAHLIDFPTLREEDLITFTSPLDPFSNGQNLEEHRYANVASFEWNQALTYSEGLHVQHLIDSQGIGNSPTSLNSFGLTMQYRCPPGMESLDRLVSAGVGYEHEMIENPVSQGLNQVYAGAVVNLRESMTDRIDFRAQDIVNFGSPLSQFQTLTDTYQASYHSIAAAIRYLKSPFGKPGYQFALTGAFRNYFNLGQANSWALSALAVKRLGEGFDVVAQVRTEWRDVNLAAQYQGQQTQYVAELGLIFNFSATVNNYIGPRRTPLNTQHRYIPD